VLSGVDVSKTFTRAAIALGDLFDFRTTRHVTSTTFVLRALRSLSMLATVSLQFLAWRRRFRVMLGWNIELAFEYSTSIMDSSGQDKAEIESLFVYWAFAELAIT
jgi:hypothetical protein